MNSLIPESWLSPITNESIKGGMNQDLRFNLLRWNESLLTVCIMHFMRWTSLLNHTHVHPTQVVCRHLSLYCMKQTRTHTDAYRPTQTQRTPQLSCRLSGLLLKASVVTTMMRSEVWRRSLILIDEDSPDTNSASFQAVKAHGVCGCACVGLCVRSCVERGKSYEEMNGHFFIKGVHYLRHIL